VYEEVKLPATFKPAMEDEFQHELAMSLDRFLCALQDDTVPETSCEDSIHTLAMVLGAIESSRKRKVVTANAGGA